MNKPLGWARLWPTSKPPKDSNVRQGAWYAIVKRVPNAVMLDNRGKYVMLPEALVEMRDQRPERFSVVARPRNATNPARGTAANVGHVYVVCPACAKRNRVVSTLTATTCSSCGHRAEIAWWESG